MNRRLILAVILIVIAVTIAAYFLVNRTNSETSIFLDPKTVQRAVDQDFLVNLTVSHVSGLYAWEFKIAWNATVLDLMNVTEGPFLKNGGFTIFGANNTAGYLDVYCTLTGPASGINGDGVLASVQFHVKTSGICDLNLFETQLIGSNDESIVHTTRGGHFSSLP